MIASFFFNHRWYSDALEAARAFIDQSPFCRARLAEATPRFLPTFEGLGGAYMDAQLVRV
jgi:hypothetical protein